MKPGRVNFETSRHYLFVAPIMANYYKAHIIHQFLEFLYYFQAAIAQYPCPGRAIKGASH
jgi:hypothetical protein